MQPLDSQSNGGAPIQQAAQHSAQHGKNRHVRHPSSLDEIRAARRLLDHEFGAEFLAVEAEGFVS